MTVDSDTRPMMTKVSITNFRSIRSAELDLVPLTVLVGPNASGKSNLLDALGFLGDIARYGLDSAITRRGGIDSVGRRASSGRVSGPGVSFSYRFPDFTVDYGFTLGRKGKGEYIVRKEFAKLASSETGGLLAEVEITNGRLTKPNLKRLTPKDSSDDSTDNSQLDPGARMARELQSFLREQDLHLITPDPPRISMFVALAKSGGVIDSRDRSFMDLDNLLRRLINRLSSFQLYHIFPNSLRDPQKVADSHPLAEGGENLASTLRDMIQRGNPFLSDLKLALGYAVPGVSDIKVSSAGSYLVIELKHVENSRLQKGTWFDLSYESDGTIRLLATLTAISQEPALSLIALEEPELAIHPGAMTILAEAMTEAAVRGQILVATHSPDLIDKLSMDSLRAVTAEDGSTKVGSVAEHQLKSVREGLFLPGELHSMEGLQPEVING